MPKTWAPGAAGCACAWRRATVTGRRITEAALTAALSMTRLITIAAVSAGTATGSEAISAIFQARCWSRGNASALRRVRTE
ncbi:Uncharacterised protein [Mycobacteroides abscessus subsp. abscessus]|nr:Uncharacterised protein [Mycobacteroides abscessus subsp. abscessus]